jgi:membrane fusion protein
MFDAFPYQKYGAGKGRVTWVSDVPTDPASLDQNLGITEPVFRSGSRSTRAASRDPPPSIRFGPA